MNYPAVEKILKECETTDVENGYVYTLGVYTKAALPELRLLLANEKKLEAKLKIAEEELGDIAMGNNDYCKGIADSALKRMEETK